MAPAQILLQSKLIVWPSRSFALLWSQLRRFLRFAATFALLLFGLVGSVSHAQPTVIGTLDYSDTFTVGPSGDPSATNPRPNGMYNVNTFGGYNVENTYGNPQSMWTPTGNFSFNSPGNSTGPAITKAAVGNDGATNGFAQSGGGDFNFTYGLRKNYVVQVDAILPLDRLDIGSYANAGDTIGSAGSLTVFFRKDSVAGQPGIALYNGSKETAVTNADGLNVKTGVNDTNWHRFAVQFDQPNNSLGIYVDGALKAKVDLATFAGGIYAGFANGAVGTGGAGFNGTQAQWMDNFAVGSLGIISVVDYRDTFTVGPSGDPSATNPRPNGMYNVNTFGGYNVENSYGNPSATWTPTGNFSFNSPDNSTGPAITQAATGNADAATGFAQSGGGDFNFAYKLRPNFVVQMDAILPLDRLDIGSYANAGDTIGSAGSLTVFFRKDSVAGQPGIALYNGSKETAVTNADGLNVKTGVNDTNWHRFAVQFDQPNNSLGIYVDGALKAKVDLATFAGGIYGGFAIGAVGTGGAGFNGTQAQWMDNFQVGLPVGVSAAPPNVPPTVSFTRPAKNDSFAAPADLIIEATAADTDGTVKQLQILRGTQVLASGTNNALSVPVSLRTAGDVILTVIATDNRGDSTTATVTIKVTSSSPAPAQPVAKGLQLWLKADAGVTKGASGTTVAAWRDQSPNGQQATQGLNSDFEPAFAASAVNGLPAVHFDGIDDFMSIPNSPALQPQSGDWTVFFVAKRAGTSRGDFPQIIGSRPWNAGSDKGWAVSFNAGGLVASHYADGSKGHDGPAALSTSALSLDTFQAWQVEENRTAGYTAFYANGGVDKIFRTAMPEAALDQANDIYIGSEVEGADNRRGNIQIAEILVYDRVLSQADREAVGAYLSGRYAIGGVVPIVAPPTLTRQPTDATVGEKTKATFDVVATGQTILYQWQKNRTDIPGAYGTNYTLRSAELTDDGAKFRVIVSNPGGSVTSDEATLRVIDDKIAPALISATRSLGDPKKVRVSFSEAIEAETVSALANYLIDNGVTITGTTFSGGNSVSLATSTLADTASYTLTVNNVKDLFGNVIVANSKIPITVSQAIFYEDLVLEDKPIAYWRLGDKGPTAVDSSGNGRNGEADGDLVWGSPSLLVDDQNAAIQGSGGRVLVPGFEKIGERGNSVEFIFSASEPPGGFRNLVGDGEGGLNFNMMVYMKPDGAIRPHFQTDTRFYALDSVEKYADGRKHHVVVTWDQATGEAVLYIDGAPVEYVPSAGTFPTVGTATKTGNKIYIGKDDREPAFTGILDEVALYDYPLSAGRVKSHFEVATGVGGPPPPKITSVTLTNDGKVVVTWPGAESLEETTTITGQWIAVPGAKSPYSTQAVGAQKFYRLRR